MKGTLFAFPPDNTPGFTYYAAYLKFLRCHIRYRGILIRRRISIRGFEFYKSLLGGAIELLTYGNSPGAKTVPFEWRDKIVHGSFKINNLEIAGADVLHGQYQQPRGFQLLLQLEDEAEAKRIL